LWKPEREGERIVINQLSDHLTHSTLRVTVLKINEVKEVSAEKKSENKLPTQELNPAPYGLEPRH
jgi:hypothetical protein